MTSGEEHPVSKAPTPSKDRARTPARFMGLSIVNHDARGPQPNVGSARALVGIAVHPRRSRSIPCRIKFDDYRIDKTLVGPTLNDSKEFSDAGKAQERTVPAKRVSSLADVPMENYHPLVPSQFGDGSWGVQPRLGRILAAWLIDLIFVGLVAAVLCSGAASAVDFFGFMAFALVLLSWVYGFCCASGNCIGTLILGTRIVRLKNAKAPGFWRGGWIMFYRIVLFITAPVLIVAGYLNGFNNTGDMQRILHGSIDKRRTAALRST